MSPAEPGRYEAEVSLLQGESVESRATASFAFHVRAEDRQLLRWYWEDFLECPLPPRDADAARAAERLTAIGAELFSWIFGGAETQKLWKQFVPQLSQNRIELVTPPAPGCLFLPWELMRDPETGLALASDSGAFVRKPAKQPLVAMEVAPDDGPLRVLLVASRPPLAPHLPFRSTAHWLIDNLAADARHPVSVELLRPPTFAQLHNVLLEAEAIGQPYHVLQIDGFGVFADIETKGIPANVGSDLSRHICTQVLPEAHGYMLFNNPTAEGSMQLVDGRSLGALMREAQVPSLVLNSCRAASSAAGGVVAPPDVASQAEVFHSVADDAMQEGVESVLHLPFNVDLETSAQFLLKTYSWLGQGLPLGQTVNQQRKRLQRHPRRQIAYGPAQLQDWPTPVVYEATAQRLVKGVRVAPPSGEAQRPKTPDLVYANAPLQPAAGFWGMEETLLEMDSVWHTHSIILLQGGPGMGKSALAAEFARWCRKTGGVDGPVLYTSFEQYQPLATLLDQLAGVFWEALDKAGYRWETLSSSDRIDVALHVLHRVPVLWIWDSIERISDPEGPRWSVERREDLMEFLQHAEATPARFVLVSRQHEGSWLEDLSVRIQVPPLAMRERLRLARHVVEGQGGSLQRLEDWSPLLEYSRGNPLVVRCLAAFVASEDLRTRTQAQNLVEQIRALEISGESAPKDGLEEPLRATIQFILQNAFRRGERKLLALLHLFKRTVSKPVFLKLGMTPWEVERNEAAEANEVPDLTEVFGSRLLERAAAQGLLEDKGNGLFAIHPVLPPFLEKLFKKYYAVFDKPKKRAAGVPSPQLHEADDEALTASQDAAEARAQADEDDEPAAPRTPVDQMTLSTLLARKMDAVKCVKKSFGVVLNQFADRCFRESESGNSDTIADLDAFEANLLFAIDLARENEWWDLAAGPVRGLGALYQGTGRIARLKDMVDRFYPHCADKSSREPLPGREAFWRALTGIAARLARARQRLHTAEAYEVLCAQWDRQQAEPYLSMPTEQLGEEESRAVRTLAESLFRLGEILRRQGFESSDVDEEAVRLREKLRDTRPAAKWARELGQHYAEILAVRNLVTAERWLRHSLELTDPEDRAGKAACLALLGQVAWERFNEARQANHPERDLIRHLSSARKYYQRALVQDSPEDHSSLSRHNQQLGHVCYAMGDLDRALPYYRECIRHAELEGSKIRAAHARFDLAIALRDSGRLEMARRYAIEAARDFEGLGDAEPGMIDRARRLVDLIERHVTNGGVRTAAAASYDDGAAISAQDR